jgi:two-component system chemotaxis sensor kinase CheA
MVTQISGRGLGLAIVQESVEKLGGLLSVDTEPNKGSSFRMQLPVTLATFRGILIKVADHLFIFPSTHVERILKIQREKVKTVENRATIPLNGRALSLLALADVLALPQKQEQIEGAEFLTAAVLGSGEKRIAFTIDELLGEQEVLVKGLGKQIKRIPNIAGATILGSGRVVPILNVFDLVKTPLERIDGFYNTQVSEQDEEANRKSILVAEDSITSRTLIKNILEAAGFKVKTAVDGQEAFTSLKTEEFDLVVSDVDMPRMNGFELTAKIRGNMRLEETPVVLLTGRESREDRERGIDVGADAYIVKSSFDQSNLVEVIQRLI